MKHSKTWAKRKMMVYLLLFLALCLFSLVSARLAPHDAELVDLLAAKHPPDAEYDRSIIYVYWLYYRDGQRVCRRHRR